MKHYAWEAMMEPQIEVFMQMRTISVMSKELAENKCTPPEMVEECKKTATRFEEMMKAYGKPKNYVVETNAKVMEHLYEAYRHIELSLTGKGSCFMRKCVRTCFGGATKNRLGYMIEAMQRKMAAMKCNRRTSRQTAEEDAVDSDEGGAR